MCLQSIFLGHYVFKICTHRLEFLNTVSEVSKSSLKSDYNWIRTVINKGTVADRIAAHTIAIQDSPVHTLHLLQNLISMVKVNKKKECIMVLGKNQPVFRPRENSSFMSKHMVQSKKIMFLSCLCYSCSHPYVLFL